ncbi:MAG: hypothetical protein F6J90_38350 [Moorea sp. SIOASIH]|uniref:hypothetical protein n=1 Tax=Moorena sp. SIOASIH TaxID=2607817 RepID=UPI0013B834DD|nr:hypothetical protein [Moorena sp. SIOASIH]NEO41873.1 hypothetical protein [Moorena sp. SIOASIH]NEO94960.1 hypothetical protein [Moorena sp. SIO3G5]
MANIKVHELSSLNLSGAELFNDSESFMTELSDESEQMAILGGLALRKQNSCGICTQGKSIIICGGETLNKA